MDSHVIFTSKSPVGGEEGGEDDLLLISFRVGRRKRDQEIH